MDARVPNTVGAFRRRWPWRAWRAWVASGVGALAAPWAALACGQVDTIVGTEVHPDAGPLTSGPDASSGSDASPDATPCTGDLSNVGAGDFHVSFTVATSQGGLVALVNQRRLCMPSVFWDVRMEAGAPYVEVDDVAHYTQLSGTATINDGRPHDVRVQRVSGVLTVYVDGALTGSGGSLASLGALAPLVAGSDVCVTSSDGTEALVGPLTNVCVTSP